MSENGDRAQGDRSMPDQVAAEAGMPSRTAGTPGATREAAGLSQEARMSGTSESRARDSDSVDAARDRAGKAARRARERASDAYDDTRGWAADRYEKQSRRAAALARRGQRRLERGRHATEDFVSENPLLIGVVGVAAGLLLGALLPRTRQEDRAIGPYADEMREQGIRYARDATRRGRAFVESALDPDNLDAAVKRSSAGEDGDPRYEGPERTTHRL